MASLLGRFLGTISGGREMKVSEQLLFDKVIGFRGVTEGVGATTLVYNTAAALSDTTNMNICVVDTHILYPVLNQYLGGSAAAVQGKDWFDFVAESENLSDIAYATNLRNVYLVSFRNRGVADMFTSLDNEKVVTTMFDTLTKFFDIVLVDLSHEATYISSISAMKCNKIYTIFEPSLGCLSSLKSSINNIVNLGVPPYKLNKVIENKHISDVNTGVQNVLNAYHFKLLASIPFSVDIARPSVMGKRLWGMASNKAAITEFNKAMDIILDDVLQTNNQTQGYLRNEDERTNIDIGEPQKRVDNEPFDYEEPEGSAKPLSRHRPVDVIQRGVDIDDLNTPPSQQGIVALKQFGNGQTAQDIMGVPTDYNSDIQGTVSNNGMPNMGVPNNGMPNMGVPNNGMPDMGVPNNGMPDMGVPNNGMPNMGVPNNGMPDMGVPNSGMTTMQSNDMQYNGALNNNMQPVNAFGAMQSNNAFGSMQSTNAFDGVQPNNAFENNQGNMNSTVNPFAPITDSNFGTMGSNEVINPFMDSQGGDNGMYQAVSPFQQ